MSGEILQYMNSKSGHYILLTSSNFKPLKENGSSVLLLLEKHDQYPQVCNFEVTDWELFCSIINLEKRPFSK